MTLDEAIKHCEDVASRKEYEINNKPHLFDSEEEMADCMECANEHRQLAEWLKELKQFRQHREEDYSYHTGYTQRKRARE